MQTRASGGIGGAALTEFRGTSRPRPRPGPRHAPGPVPDRGSRVDALEIADDGRHRIPERVDVEPVERHPLLGCRHGVVGTQPPAEVDDLSFAIAPGDPDTVAGVTKLESSSLDPPSLDPSGWATIAAYFGQVKQGMIDLFRICCFRYDPRLVILRYDCAWGSNVLFVSKS